MGIRLLAVACLVGAALAGPLQRESKCATSCSTSSNSKFNYEPGKKYVYDYKGVNHVIVAGQKKQKTEIQAQVEVNVKSKCDLVLRMKDISIEHKAPWSETADLVQKLEVPLPYSFQDGQIEHICPSTEETKQSLNIKRAVLSAFINSMDDLESSQEMKEVDSLGSCQTRYIVKSGRQILIEKEKDLKSCTNRHSSISSLMANQYESPESYIHTIPIFPQEKLSCKQAIEEKVLRSAECFESSTIKPLPQKDSLIELQGHMNMRLIRVDSSDRVRLPPQRTRESLLFSLEEESSVEDKKEEVKMHLKEMCAKNTESIDLAVSKDFIELVSDVKRLSYESLQEIYSALESGSLCSSKKLTDLFLDTLPMAGNDASIRLMVSLLMEGRVSGLKAKLWTASLALVSKPSYDAISAVVPLIKKEKSGSVLLGVSAMVYRHCSYYPCDNSKPIEEIIMALNKVLGRQCSYENENEAIAVLKAFGNMGQLLHAEKTILACAQDADKNIRVRLAAVDAFRRVNKTKPDELLHLYADPQEHYEIRIAALSSVLRQANQQQLHLIKSIAERESDEQVSTYCGTLLSNYNKTSCPLRKHVKQLLHGMHVEVPATSYWQNSKNIEMSTFSEPLNIGASVEADIVHSPSTKIPRSIYTRFDIDVFDKHVNVFEVGMRAEGLEAAFKKLIGLKSKQQRSSWNLLSSSSESDEDKVQASFFFRTMETEIFDLSADDLTGMGQMIKFADLLNKVSHDKTADFSHSFMFINSHLVIPSVTGRSYSFGMTGSATVGLTASSKLDIVNIMSKPKNCDVHGHLKPSVNVELTAQVGIHSEKPRPDVKIVTRFHSESNIEAQFKIKDGHLGLFKVSMPSENIVLTRVSSDIIEIDANHQEKRLYENMQSKVDYCFDKLEKPLGVSICGKWEVPRPFLSKTFPFVKGVGNVELSIKKADPGMQGFELSFEIPKHKGHLMKYRAVMDTPGSKINRRFTADLEIKSPSRDLKEFTMLLQSPFRSVKASATGSLAMHPDLLELNADLQAGTSHRYSLKASSPVSETASQKIYKPSIQLSSTSFSPLKVDGSLTVTKGRKQEISFDLAANKPSRKPIVLKGSIVKDGKLSWAKDAEWKLSTDVGVKTPMLNLQVRSTTEKQSKLAHTISSTLSLDYQKERSRRQSVKFATKFQKSSSKISSTAQMESSEYPSTNFALTWNMQGKLKESLKNDISLKYGRDPERQYINILQSSKISESQSGECKLSVKAPQFNIDSELTSTYDIKKNSKVHAEVDIRYKADKHVRSKFHLDNLSQKPLKLRIKAEVQTPTNHIIYSDVLEEFAPSSYRGNAMLQMRPNDKRVEFQYKYWKKSDRSKMHHEIETSLRLPNWQSPIKQKSSFQMSRENLAFQSRWSLNRNTEISATADLNKWGTSYVTLVTPKVEGNLKVVNEQWKKVADFDVKLNLYRRPRHIIASTSWETKNANKLQVEISLDADRHPENKILLATMLKNTRNTYQVSTEVQVMDKIKMEMSASGDAALFGKHEISTQATLFNLEPVEIHLNHEMSREKTHTVLRLVKAQRPKLELSFGGECPRNSREFQLATYASLESLNNEFPTKKWSTLHTYSQSRSSFNLKSTAKLEWSPRKVYDSEISCDFQPSIVLMKAYLHTPHRNFEKQLIGFSFRKSESLILSSANLELSNGKTISFETESKIKSEGLTSSLIVKSPFEKMRELKTQIELQNQKHQKSLKTSCQINGNMVSESELTMQSTPRGTEIKGKMKANNKPELSLRITIEKSREAFKYDAQIMKESANLLSATVSKQVSGQECFYALESSHQEKALINLKISREMSQGKISCMLEAQGPLPHVSFALESLQSDKKSRSLSITACQLSDERLCYYAKVHHKTLIKEDNYIFYRKMTLDVEKSAGNASPVHVANINILASVKEHEFKEKMIIQTGNNQIGYDFRLHRRDSVNDHCSMETNIYMAKRVARVKGSVLHNSKSVSLDFEIVPDLAVPSRKLGLELKKDMAGKDVSGYLKLSYPGMRKPIEVSGHIQKEGMLPVSGKIAMDYSAVGGKTFILEIIPEPSSRRQSMKSVEYKLYSEDKTTDLSAKLTKFLTREESTLSYEWSVKTSEIRTEGKMSVRLYDKADGIPKAFEIEIVTPRATSKAICQTTWESYVPTNVYFSFGKGQEKLAEVNMKVQDRCLIVEETLKSKQYMTHRVCMWKHENTLKVISVQSYYQRKPCLEFEIEADEHQHKLFNVNLKWSRKNIEQAQREARQFVDEVKDMYVSAADLRALKHTYWSAYHKCCEQLRQAKERVQAVASRHFSSLKEQLIKAKHFTRSKIWEIINYFIPAQYSEIVHTIIDAVDCLWDKSVRFMRIHLPEMLRALSKQIIDATAECLKNHCPRDSVCYDVATLLVDFELERAKTMVSRRFELAARKLSERLDRAEFPDVIEWFYKTVEDMKGYLSEIFEETFGGVYAERIRNYWYEKQPILKEALTHRYGQFVEWVRWMLKRAESDEDFRVLKSLAVETKDKAIRAWNQKESFIKNSKESLKNSMNEFPRKMVENSMTIRKFAPKEGKIEIQVKNPLEPKHVLILKNAFISMKNRILSALC